MRIRWYGQSTFLISGERAVFIDPFGDMSGLAADLSGNGPTGQHVPG